MRNAHIAILLGVIMAAAGCVYIDDLDNPQPGDDDTGGDLLEAPVGVYTGPLMVAASHYAAYRDDLFPQRPFWVYAWVTDPSIGDYEAEVEMLASIEDDVTKMVVFSNYATLDAVLEEDGEYLAEIGVRHVAYVTEDETTPESQMLRLDSSNPDVNPAARFAQIATEYRLDVVWMPTRTTADGLDDAALITILASGVDAVVLQEQEYIDTLCADERVAAVEQTAQRYRQLANDDLLHVSVQLTSTSCVSGDDFADAYCPDEQLDEPYDHCEQFIGGVASTIDSVAIWAPEMDDLSRLVDFVDELREPDES